MISRQSLEEKLDEISDGKLEYKVVLRDFWRDFSAAIDDIKELRVGDVLDALNEDLAPLAFPARADGSNPRICPKCGTGNLSLKLGKFGAFRRLLQLSGLQLHQAIGRGSWRSRWRSRRKATSRNARASILSPARKSPSAPDASGPTSSAATARKPSALRCPRAGPSTTPTMKRRWRCCRLPRDIGKHPETGKMISAGVGRYGPYVTHDGTFANVELVEEVFSIGLNRAVTVLAEKQAKGPGRGRTGTPAALKALGNHPDDNQPITVRDGKYGAYVNHGKTNATLPKGKDPSSR